MVALAGSGHGRNHRITEGRSEGGRERIQECVRDEARKTSNLTHLSGDNRHGLLPRIYFRFWNKTECNGQVFQRSCKLFLELEVRRSRCSAVLLVEPRVELSTKRRPNRNVWSTRKGAPVLLVLGIVNACGESCDS